MADEKPRSKAFQLDRVDKAQVTRSSFWYLVSALVVVLPMLAAGFDTSTAVGGIAVTVGTIVVRAGRAWLANNQPSDPNLTLNH